MLSSCETGGTGIRREKMEEGETLVFPPSAAIYWLYFFAQLVVLSITVLVNITIWVTFACETSMLTFACPDVPF